MKDITETRRVNYIKYLRFSYFDRVDTSAGGVLVPEVVNVSDLTLFIGYSV